MARLIRNARRRGLALVETALVLPVVVLLVMGILEYGWLFLVLQDVHAAARHGARVGITFGADKAMVEAEVDALMAGAGLGSSGYGTDVDPIDVGSMAVGEVLTVTVSVEYGGNLEIIGFLPVPGTIQGSVSMAKDGPQ